MIINKKIIILFIALHSLSLHFSAGAPLDEIEERRRHRRRRPCAGRSDPEGRTFFDWSLSYIDSSHNSNYIVNCGGSGGGGGLGGGGHGGGGHGGGGHGGLFGGNRPGGGHGPLADFAQGIGEAYSNFRPGQYITASNPIFGNFVQQLPNINPNRLLNQVTNEVNKFFGSLFRR